MLYQKETHARLTAFNPIFSLTSMALKFIMQLETELELYEKHRKLATLLNHVFQVDIPNDYIPIKRYSCKVIKPTTGLDLLTIKDKCSNCEDNDKINFSFNFNSFHGAYARTYKEEEPYTPDWEIKDGRLVKMSNRRYAYRYAYLGSKTDDKYQLFDWLIKTIDDLLLLEVFYPNQRFVKYFDMTSIMKTFNGEISTTNADPAFAIIYNGGFSSTPTDERLRYLLWKTFLSDYCEYSTFCKSNLSGDILDYHYSLNDDMRITPMMFKEISEHLKSMLWRSKWNVDNVSWTNKIIDATGKSYTIYIHEHEFPDSVRYVDCDPAHRRFPTNVNTPPKTFYREAHLELLKRKKALYQIRAPFTAIDVNHLTASTKLKIIPIIDTVGLMREGVTMNHCIGGESYLSNGINKEHLYFRFVPNGISIDDIKSQFTVTLSRHTGGYANPKLLSSNYYDDNQPYGSAPSYTADDRDDKERYHLDEVWGYKNEVPTPQVMQELYQFLYDNQVYLTTLTN